MYDSFVHYRILTYELPVESLKIVHEAEIKSDNALGTIHKLLLPQNTTLCALNAVNTCTVVTRSRGRYCRSALTPVTCWHFTEGILHSFALHSFIVALYPVFTSGRKNVSRLRMRKNFLENRVIFVFFRVWISITVLFWYSSA